MAVSKETYAFFRSFARTAQIEEIKPNSKAHLALNTHREDIGTLPEGKMQEALVRAHCNLAQGYDVGPGSATAKDLAEVAYVPTPIQYLKTAEQPLSQQVLSIQTHVLDQIAKNPALAYLVEEKNAYDAQLLEWGSRESENRPHKRAYSQLQERPLPLLDSLTLPRSGNPDQALAKWESALVKFSEYDHTFGEHLPPHALLVARKDILDTLQAEPHGVFAADLDEKGAKAIAAHFPVTAPADDYEYAMDR
jgi:hypothetical protein